MGLALGMCLRETRTWPYHVSENRNALLSSARAVQDAQVLRAVDKIGLKPCCIFCTQFWRSRRNIGRACAGRDGTAMKKRQCSCVWCALGRELSDLLVSEVQP